MDSFVKKVYDDILAGSLLQGGEHVVVGVSGGADSICLFYVLQALQPILQLTLTAVHVHHGLRGAAADDDRAFVENICAAEGIECRSFQADIRQLAEERHCSEEEAGRLYRYECFEKVRAAKGADKIAVAHHMDDTSETVLMNLFRGSGIKGLAGIPAVRGTVIRPLLHTSRREIETYLEQNDISYRTDATNFEVDYTRNRIRLDVLPYVKAHINSAASEHIAETAALAADISSYIERQAREAEQRIVRNNIAVRGYELDAEAFIKEDKVIQRELLRQVMGKAAGQMKDIGMVHIETVRRLASMQVGRQISLPYGLRAVRTYGTIRIECVQAADAMRECHKAIGVPIIQVPGRYPIHDVGKWIDFKTFSYDKNMQFPKKMYTKWFDYDKIKNRLVLRQRQEGDYLMLRGGSRKLLRRIMVDSKIPQADRATLTVLADGSHIVWIPAMGRISEYYKINEETKCILAAELKEIEDGRED